MSSKIRLYGSTSGYVELEAPAVGDNGTLVLPTAAQGFIPPGIGSNVVQTVLTSVFETSSDTYVNVTGLTATITPSSDDSKVLIIAQVAFALVNADNFGAFRLSGGNATDYVGNADGSRVQGVFGGGQNADSAAGLYMATMVFLDSPNTTSATTYAVQARRNAGAAARVNRSRGDADSVGSVRGASSITLIEVAV